MNCPHCQAEVLPDAVFCHRCGESLAAEAPTANQEASPASRLRERQARNATVEGSERELWRGAYSGKAMIEHWIVAALATVVSPVLGAALPLDSQGWLVLLSALGLLWIALALLLLYRRLNVRYVLTNRRLLHDKGILSRHSRRIEVIDIDDVGFRQTLVNRLMGVGTIEIESSDRSDPKIRLPGIDRVEQVASLIDDARRAERVRRGLHVEAI